MSLPEIMTVQDIADYLFCSRKHVISEIQSGKLKAFRVANRYLVDQIDLLSYMERQRICPDETRDRTFGSTKARTPTSFAGTSRVSRASEQREQETMDLLKKPSQSSFCLSEVKVVPIRQTNGS